MAKKKVEQPLEIPQEGADDRVIGSDKHLKIISFLAENVKRLKAVSIRPSSSVVELNGPNEAGKSSVLDAIAMALSGREIPEMPIREGAKKGLIELDLGEYTIIRSLTPKGAYLKIEAKDGREIERPQEFLDRIVGKVSFDPLDFINKNDDKKQREVLLGLLGIDVADLDKREKNAYDERTLKGRELKTVETKAKALPRYDDIRNDQEEESITDISNEFQEANRFNEDIVKRLDAQEARKQRAVAIKAEIANLTQEMADLKEVFVSEQSSLSSTTVKSIDAISSRMANVEIVNQKVRANKEYAAAWKEYNVTKSAYESIDKSLESIRAERTKLISSATMPIDGLTFDDSGLLYNGIPLKQCSDGRKLMVAMAISMALNPTLRVLRIKDGSLLDKGNLQILKEMVEGKDYQLWIERVADRESYDKNGGGFTLRTAGCWI